MYVCMYVYIYIYIGDPISFEDRAGIAQYAPAADLTSHAFQRRLVDDCDKLAQLGAVARGREPGLPGQVMMMMFTTICAGD